jgi:hypothetical protein
MKLSNIIFGNLLKEDRTSEELLKNIQPAIGKALQDYYAQIKNLSAAMVKDFGVDLLNPASDFSDAGLKLIQNGKSREGSALQNYPRQNIQSLKNRLSINTKNPIALDNKLKGLKQVLLSQMGATAAQGADSTKDGIQGRAGQDLEARMTKKTEEGKALMAKLDSFRSDEEKEKYILSPEFKQLIQKVDPNFLTKAKGMAKVNPEAVTNISGFRIKANKFLQESMRGFLFEQESTLDGFIFNDIGSVTNSIENFRDYLTNNRIGPNTTTALQNLLQTVASIKDNFKAIKIPSEIAKSVKQSAAAPAAAQAPAAAPAAAPPPQAAQKAPPPDTNKLASDIFGSIPSWKDYLPNTPFGQTINQMKDYVTKLSKETDPAKTKGPKDWLKANFKSYIDNQFNQFKENPQHAALKQSPMLKALQTSVDEFIKQVSAYASS